MATDGPADRSLAVRLTLNSDEATLTEEQIEAAVAAVVQSADNHSWVRVSVLDAVLTTNKNEDSWISPLKAWKRRR